MMKESNYHWVRKSTLFMSEAKTVWDKIRVRNKASTILTSCYFRHLKDCLTKTFKISSVQSFPTVLTSFRSRMWSTAVQPICFCMGSPLIRALTQPKCLCLEHSSAESRTGPNQRHVWRFNLCAVSRFHSGWWETPPRSPWAIDLLSEPFNCDGFPAQRYRRPFSLFYWGW